MHYRISHSTIYSYGNPVRVCHNYVMLTPREQPSVACHSHRLVIRPTPKVSGRRTDYFGNTVHSFSIEENHKQLQVIATSRVTVTPRELPPPETTLPWEQVVAGVASQADSNWLRAAPFLYDSPRVRRNREFEAAAREAFPPGRPILEAVIALTTQVHQHFKYDSRATTVDTPVETAFRLARGVCQDFAQVQVACLRSIGVPARYVSGYLRTLPPPGKPRLVGVDQSHAWVAVYCGEDLGWVDVDPTNDGICRLDHIPIAWGRDYGDVAPIKGVFLGGGEHHLTVSVDVSPIEDDRSVSDAH